MSGVELMLLANRLSIPSNAAAILWDMDGVVLDTLTFDYEICNKLLESHAGVGAQVSRAQIRAFFPYDLAEFWKRILEACRPELSADKRAGLIAELVKVHVAAREATTFKPNPGVEQILQAARAASLKLAVVSNNPTAEVNAILSRSGVLQWFDNVIGNDVPNIAKKPAPDPYLHAAKVLGGRPQDCVVVEDSLLGAESGRRAGCFTVGVATGAATFEDLEKSGFADRVYSSFAENVLVLNAGHVTKKSIVTPNDFVSHMIEHIAWRLGSSIQLSWSDCDWLRLGEMLGDALGRFERSRDSAAVLGMIDDGSAEVSITAVASAAESGVTIKGTSQVDVDWFLSLRCEQIKLGKPLIELLNGIASKLPAKIDITICSLEDPHHTWEGVFRSIGIALNHMLRLTAPAKRETVSAASVAVETPWRVQKISNQSVEVIRRTAESLVRVLMDFSGYAAPKCRFEVSESIHVDGLSEMLDLLCRGAGMRLEVDFRAITLSSSHVVMEDVGMVMGRTLQEIFIQRMNEMGVNGAGSSVSSTCDLEKAPVHVGLSVEGRKFWTFVPMAISFDELRRSFLVGHDVGRGLFSEDLDDFIDGFSGGLTGSVVIHIRKEISPQEGWPLIFESLGKAIAQAMQPNPFRIGVPPGVKATLA
jgi:HAD superfamily hydrolase (TIGR01509 family)